MTRVQNRNLRVGQVWDKKARNETGKGHNQRRNETVPKWDTMI